MRDRRAAHPGCPAQVATLRETTSLVPIPLFLLPLFTLASSHGVAPPPSAVCTRATLVRGVNLQQPELDPCSLHWGKAAACSQLGASLHPGWACPWGQHIAALFLTILFPFPATCLSHELVGGQGRGQGLRDGWEPTNTCPQPLLPFSSRPHSLKGLMHLPLSCCEMQRLKNSSTGSPARRGGRCLQEQTAQRMAAVASLASQ